MWLVRAITQTQNYSGCSGNYINFYSKLVAKIIMTELFEKLRKPCFWSLLTQALIVPQTWAALVFEDYKFLASCKEVEKPNVKILRKATNRCTENTYFYGTFVLLCMGQIIDFQRYWSGL